MKAATTTFMANLRHAIGDAETINVGGGAFLPGELKDVLSDLQDLEQLSEAQALLDRIENIEASQATMTSIMVRTETRLCKLLTHLGAAHLIETNR